MSLPRINVPKERLDYILIGLGLFGLLSMIALTVFHYEQLPEQIPTHFDLSGQADAYGEKSTIWFIVMITGALVVILNLVNRVPHLVNYSVPITEENAPRQYQNLQRLNRTMTAVISLCLAYIHYAIIQMSLGNREGLGLWFLLLFLTLIFGSLGYFLYRAHIIE